MKFENVYFLLFCCKSSSCNEKINVFSTRNISCLILYKLSLSFFRMFHCSLEHVESYMYMWRNKLNFSLLWENSQNT